MRPVKARRRPARGPAVPSTVLGGGRTTAGAGLGGGAPGATAAEYDAVAALGRIPWRYRRQDEFGYSWFCDLYREWVGRLKPTLRQVHIAGERVFVDFAGHTMEVNDGATGEVRRAEIFVAVLGPLATPLQKRPGRNRCLTG